MLEETMETIPATRRASQASGVALFDAKAALERLDGDEELFAMLAAVFQQDSVELFDQLSSGMASGNLAQVQRAAHSLKGLSANFDAQQATEAAFKIEDLTRRGVTTGLEQSAVELRDHLEQLRRALAHWQA